jgi:hypothetical protein
MEFSRCDEDEDLSTDEVYGGQGGIGVKTQTSMVVACLGGAGESQRSEWIEDPDWITL